MPVITDSAVNHIEFCEENFLIKTLETKQELTQAYQLRHRVFAEQLKWVPETEDRQEMDMYDLWGQSIGIINRGGKLHGLARILPSSGPFMLEHDLRLLLPPEHIMRKETDTAEITRLAIDPDIKDKGLSARLLLLMVKGIYHWAIAHDVRYFYIEVDYRFFRVLNAMAISCHPLSPPVALPPANTPSIAAMLDIVRCEEILGGKRPQVMEWMSTVTTTQGNIVKRATDIDMRGEPSFLESSTSDLPDGVDRLMTVYS
jgi:acyl homoserine lactone synthase